MIKPFERADEANDAVELAPATYNRMVDTLERLAALTVAPPLQISDSAQGSPAVISLGTLPRPQPGLIVCYGPGGEPDYADQRYWVQFAKCSNNDNDPKSNLDFIPDGSGTIVTATDLFEYNAQTHNLSPGTPVLLFSITGQDGVRRWLFIAADETPNGQMCQGSGSSSESAVCYCVWTYVYDCTTQTATSYTGATSCGNNTGFPDDTWSLSASTGTTCTWVFPQRFNVPCDPAGSGSGECAAADSGALCSPGNRPNDGPTPAQIKACCNPANYCWELWSLEYFCPSSGNLGGFNEPEYEHTTCGNQTGMAPGVWTLQNTGDPSYCLWYCIVPTINECSSTVACPQVTTHPALPANPPAWQCNCGSGSGSASYCYDIWQCLVSCGSGDAPSPGAVSLLGSNCSNDTVVVQPHPPGVWYSVPSLGGDPAGTCRYNIWILSATVCTSDGDCDTGPYTSTPVIPATVYMSCCTDNCPTGGGNYAWCCIAGVKMWVPIVNQCPGSGS